jgi:hypothetical protein
MMEMVMGKMPERFARAGARSKPEFFKEGAKLDWPKPKASRQSKKDVRSTRALSVCTSIYLFLVHHTHPSVGCHTSNRHHQPAILELGSEAPYFRSCAAHNGPGRSQPPVLLAEHLQ